MPKKKNRQGDVPLGLGMALAQNTTALERFASLSPSQKEAVLRKAGQVNSKQEMQFLVQELAEGQLPGIGGAASSTECTGLKPTPAKDSYEEDSYRDLYSTELPK
ncbi:MAG TPA: hypothetical protein GXZ52_05830 [Clostridiales bacterium]|jgi:hypothetical protein|nr:hypothetical protein [Clostridiales bacterium]